MDVNTVVSFTANAATAILGIATLWKVAAKWFKSNRAMINKTTPVEITTNHAIKPGGVRLMDSIIPLGSILLAIMSLFVDDGPLRIVTSSIALLVSSLYLLFISTYRS